MNIFLLGILIAGAPAFGLEALLIGNKGNISLYSDKKLDLVKDLLITGLAIVIFPIFLDYFLVLNPLYLIALVFAMIFITGGFISLLGDEKGKGRNMLSENTSDSEIKEMLKDRGLDQLISEEDSSKD